MVVLWFRSPSFVDAVPDEPCACVMRRASGKRNTLHRSMLEVNVPGTPVGLVMDAVGQFLQPTTDCELPVDESMQTELVQPARKILAGKCA